MTVKLLTEHHLEFLSLKGDGRGSSESTHVKMSHCWKSHALAQIYFIILSSKLNRQIVGIQMRCNCAPLVAYLFLFCYERDFMFSLSDNNQAGVIITVNSTDGSLNIDYPYIKQMVDQIYPTEFSQIRSISLILKSPFLTYTCPFKWHIFI